MVTQNNQEQQQQLLFQSTDSQATGKVGYNWDAGWHINCLVDTIAAMNVSNNRLLSRKKKRIAIIFLTGRGQNLPSEKKKVKGCSTPYGCVSDLNAAAPCQSSMKRDWTFFFVHPSLFPPFIFWIVSVVSFLPCVINRTIESLFRVAVPFISME
jgi:hypothetical protein